MGFRSTLISEDNAMELPTWFCEKWEYILNFGISYTEDRSEAPSLPISTKGETKEYYHSDLYIDLQRVLTEGRQGDLDLVWLHECGGITKVTVTPERVWFGEPDLGAWNLTDDVTHFYCYGCTELKPVRGSTINPDAPKRPLDQVPPDGKNLHERD